MLRLNLLKIIAFESQRIPLNLSFLLKNIKKKYIGCI